MKTVITVLIKNGMARICASNTKDIEVHIVDVDLECVDDFIHTGPIKPSFLAEQAEVQIDVLREVGYSPII